MSIKSFVTGALVTLAVSSAFFGALYYTAKSQEKTQSAYSEMYDGLRAKSQNHRNLVDFYLGCMNSQIHNPRGGTNSHQIDSSHCLDETRIWSAKLQWTTSVQTILDDIQIGEGAVYFKLKG